LIHFVLFYIFIIYNRPHFNFKMADYIPIINECINNIDVISNKSSKRKLNQDEIDQLSATYIDEATDMFTKVFPQINKFVHTSMGKNVYIVDVNNLSMSPAFYICANKLYSKLTSNEQEYLNKIVPKFEFGTVIEETPSKMATISDMSDIPYNIHADLKKYKAHHISLDIKDYPNIHDRSQFVLDFFTKYCSKKNKYILVFGFKLDANYIQHRGNIALISSECVLNSGNQCYRVFPYSHSVDDILVVLIYMFVSSMKETTGIISHDNYRWFKEECNDIFYLQWAFFNV